MAKKFVRGVTGVDDIEKFDKSLTNINDLISDGQDTYVHTKKGKVESYYNLTDNVKQVQSIDDLLTINKQDNTVKIANKGLATKGDLSAKQDKLSVGDGLLLSNNKIVINPSNNSNPSNVNGFYRGVASDDIYNSAIISLSPENNRTVQLRFRESSSVVGKISMKYRFVNSGVQSQWQDCLIDSDTITSSLSAKQNTITNNTSIGVNGSGLQQLYTLKQTYNVSGGMLKTYVKSVSANTSVSTAEEEFNFIVKIDKGVSSVNFTLNTHNTTKFQNIITTYGANNTVSISGCVFTLSGSTLTVSTTNNTAQNYVITFSDII